jgi:prepilin-type N-terminal cleavage/methylation domain-containing protein
MFRQPPASHGVEDGFTLLELMVVMLIMGVVLLVAGSALISLSTTTNRGSAMVTDEQVASGALAQMGKDIRSAHAITFPSGAVATDAPNEVVLQENKPGGGTTPVEWIYSPTAATLTREVLNSSGSVVSTGPVVAKVANASTTSLLSYYKDDGSQIVPTSGSTTALGKISSCTTRIQVHLFLAPGVSGVANFEESEDVAITDQLAILSAPGNGQC